MSITDYAMRKLLLATLFASLFISTGSCRIDDPGFPFQIIVEGANGNRVQNAFVNCFVPLPNTDIRYTGYTDVSGTKYFRHEGGEVVLQVQVTKGEDPISAAGCGYIKLEPNQLVQQLIIVDDYDPLDPGCE